MVLFFKTPLAFKLDSTIVMTGFQLKSLATSFQAVVEKLAFMIKTTEHRKLGFHARIR